MISLKIAFVGSLLLASIVDQVYSTTACFTCIHESTEGNATIDCMEKPAHIKFVKPCTLRFQLPGGLAPFAHADSDIKYKCMTFKTTGEDSFEFQRGCWPNFITCDLLKNSLASDRKLETCKECDGDLCNASSKAGIAIFTLISCLITSYVVFN